jgi:hypothetical protein
MLYVYAAFPALFTMIGLGKIVFSFGSKRIEKRAIQNALAGRPPKDGEVYAFLGILKADGDVLTSPFSGQNCILYEYSLTETVHQSGRHGEGRITEEIRFSGFHLCPCHIHTMLGPIAIHVFPQSSVSVSTVCMVDPKQSARSFVQQTRFRDAHGLKYFKQSGEIAAQLMKDVEPPVSMDVSFTGKRDSDDLNINEDYVPPGTEVYLLARYDAKRNAAVAGNYGAQMSSLDRDLLETWARGSWIRSFVWGLVFAFIGLGIGILPLGPSGVLEDLGSPGKSMLELREQHLWSAIREDQIPLPWRVVNFFEPDARDYEGRTLLMSTNEPGVLRHLLERGADPNAVDHHGETALQKVHRLDAAKVLLEYGADASVLGGGYSARLFFAALSELDTRGVSLFLQNGMSPETFSADGKYPLLVVVSKCGDGQEDRAVDIARMLVEKGGKAGVSDADGLTALDLATRQCGREMVDLLSDTRS